MDAHEHPLRRRYALELALGLALIALAAWAVFERAERDTANAEGAPRSVEGGR